MTNWTPRDFDLALDFLDPGNYEMTIYADGINADKVASDYATSTRDVRPTDMVKIHLAPGGGWVARLKKLD
jgi:alpha-glucosidase